MEIYGFTLLRNGVKYDYPFRESISSLKGLTPNVVLALGKSEDGTEAAVAGMGLTLVHTVWDENKREGGLILSEQTNIALLKTREIAPKSAWGFYLQADEVISEQDYERIRADIERADAEGYDVVSFRYLHFWQSYEKIAYDKRWYPQEIRAVKLSSPVESYGDAQSFCGWKKPFESEATVYHYGHVREASAYDRKKKDFHRWWHPDAEMAKIIARGDASDKTEPTLAYLGPHPAVMKKRIGIDPPQRKKVFVYGDESAYSPEFRARILATEVVWTNDLVSFGELQDPDFVILKPPPLWARFLHSRRFNIRIPEGMRSPRARPWTQEFQALLAFSEKGIYFK